MEEYVDRVEELEQGKKRLQVELDDLISTRSTADKNVHELEKAKRALESQLAEQKTQVILLVYTHRTYVYSYVIYCLQNGLVNTYYIHYFYRLRSWKMNCN